ncbi:argininosuccinate lyase [Algisphaera agarilytica]|uniref:Argininosuccinate lyase n=1 Tax=Algisphaera agarilytica TaxID=1385975 RepID=A0A7X0LLI5_9BACT|nr:argininosuccinate lyase [Algisphaera agarilytica]MBB6430008.1 argininosuccinate lyase [Algisphaera agarilytica]
MSQKPWEHAKSSGSEGDPLAARFVSSLDYDKRLYKHDIAGSIAHARMLLKVGLITDGDLAEIERGLSEIESEIDEQGDAWPGWKVELEDVHMCVEAALIEKTGDAGRKLHTGRSRNDQVATDLMLWLEYDGYVGIQSRWEPIMSAFVDLADKYGHIVMPSYTHLQRAQPIVVGGELMAWALMLQRAFNRISSPYQLRDFFPLGSGAIAGSSLPLDRRHSSQELGSPYWDQLTLNSESSIEGTANRDMALDFVWGLSMISTALSRWAEQWIIYATTEFGFITLDNLYTTGSSMMPQKQNPDMLELIRGKTGQVYGSLMALLTMCKGITIGYNRDLQEDKRHVFAAYDAVCDCLDMAAAIVRTTTFNEERIKAGLNRGYLDATSLAEYLVTKGVPFRTSHQHVGALVRLAGELDRHELKKLTLDEMKGVCDAIEEDVYDWLGPENVVKRYQSAGNAGVSGFEAQLASWKERLGNS